ncbi:type II toxin-antitoxin system ParD family antitoxin [Caballeronia glebae]
MFYFQLAGGDFRQHVEANPLIHPLRGQGKTLGDQFAQVAFERGPIDAAQFRITLPNEMAEFVRTKVASGDYASDSEVLRDALRVLRERDRAVEAWLRNEVVPAAQALRDDPSRALSADQVRAELKKSRTRHE